MYNIRTKIKKDGKELVVIDTSSKDTDMFEHYRKIGISQGNECISDTPYVSLTKITGIKQHGFVFEPYKGRIDEKEINNNFYVLLERLDDHKAFKADVSSYICGYVLNAGFTSENLLGQPVQAYIGSVNTHKLKFSSKHGAKVFKTKQEVLKTIQKYNGLFERAAEKGMLKLEYTCDEYEDDQYQLFYNDSKKSEAERKISKQLQEELDKLNKVYVMDTIPEIYTEEAAKHEAEERLKYLKVHPAAINDFRENGVIWISVNATEKSLNQPYSRAICSMEKLEKMDDDQELQEGMEKIKGYLKELREHGKLPYHVIISNPYFDTEPVEMINVLYVSKYVSDWDYERPTREGYLEAAVASEMTFGDLEYGSIRVVSDGDGFLHRIE